jgi:hypothetical protein
METENENLEQKTQEASVRIIRKHNVYSSIAGLPPGYEIHELIEGASYYSERGYSVVDRPVSKKLREKFPCLDNIYVVKYATFEPLKGHKKYGVGQKWAGRTMLKKACYVAEKAMEYRNKRLEEEISEDC